MKFMTKPLLLIVALLSVWSSQAMAALSEADLQRFIAVQQALSERRDELAQLDPEERAEAEAEAEWQRKYDQAMASDDDDAIFALEEERMASQKSLEDLLKPRRKSFDEEGAEALADLREKDALWEAMEDIVQDNGFSDLRSYWEVQQSVVKAVMFLSIQRGEAETDSLRETYRDSGLSEEYIAKSMAARREMTRSSRDYIGDVPEQDSQLVARFEEELLQVLSRSAEDEDDY